MDVCAIGVGPIPPSLPRAGEWLSATRLAVLAAQLAGRRLVATRVGGVPELIEDGAARERVQWSTIP